MRQQFTMLVPADLVISNNRLSQIWLRTKVKNGMSALTLEAARDRYPVGKADITIGIEKRTRGAYDPTNITDTFKGCIDALVRTGVLDDDDYKHVGGPWLYHYGVDKHIPPKHIRATITLTDYTGRPKP